jgi:hypothetical protein
MPSFVSAARRIPTMLLLAAPLALVIAFAGAASASARPYHQVVNAYSGRALMPKDGSTAWGTTIVQQNRVPSSAAQMWFIEHVGSAGETEIWRFKNRQSNRCIHPSDWSGLNGTRLLQATCSNNPEAKWYRYSDATGKLSFQSVRTWDFMDISNGSTLPGANAVQNDDYGSLSQRWRLEYAGDF